MSKTITLKFENKTYTLAYTRESVTAMEQTGFVADDLFVRPMTMLPMLFYGAFRANHKGIKRRDTDRIYNSLENRADLISALVEMYRDTITSLMVDDNEDGAEGNATWTVNE
jgi:hypothetical protein